MRGRYCAVHPQVQRKRHKTAILQCPSSSRWDSHCGPVSKLEPWRAPEPTTLFMQYKHSGLASRTSDVAVSTMNSEVSKLHNRLKKARVAGSKVDFLVGDKPHRRRRCGSRLPSSLGVQSHSRGACSSTWLSWACATGNSQTPG